MMSGFEIFTGLLAASFAVTIISYLYRYNMAFKLMEHLLLGITMGITLFAAYQSILSTGIVPMTKGSIVAAISLILGLLLLTRFKKETRAISFIPLSIIIGIGLGLSIRGAITTQFVNQILATIGPIWPLNTDNVNNFIILLGASSTLTYFIFTKEHKGALGSYANVGKYFLMVYLGAQFGSGGATRLAYSIVPMELMATFPGIYLTLLLGLWIIYDYYKNR